MLPEFGKVIVTEQLYQNGNVKYQIRRTEEMLKVHDRKELFDHILEQLKNLDTCDEVHFSVYADKDTRSPNRISIATEEKL